MAFVKKDWQNRIVPYPYRRRLTVQSATLENPESGLQPGDQILCTIARDEYDEEPDWEHSTYQQGDSFSATNMNGLEQRIYDAVDATGVDSKMDKADPIGSGTLSINRLASSQIGNYSTAVGRDGTASGSASFAEGDTTIASGTGSHAEGDHTIASGDQSHAEGLGTIAASANQHASGKYNIEDAQDTYVEVVGNGTSTTPSNARTLDWSGNETIAGDLIFNGNTSLTSALSDKADVTDVPTVLSDLTNDEGFIDNTVSDLTNYYLKTDTYTQAEVNALINTVSWNQIESAGTKIAEITINGAVTGVFAPTGGGGGATSLGGLSDVTITSATDGQTLIYDANSGIWVNGSGGGGGASSLSQLSDVTLTSPSAGQALTYDAINQKWVNVSLAASSISYSNTVSGLVSTDTQSAIDELASTLGDVESLLASI